MKIIFDKRLEFMQKIILIAVVISIIFTAASYVLSIFDKNPVETLSMTIIQTLWGTTGTGLGAYALQNCVRAITSSKWGKPKEDVRKEETNDEH